MLGSKGYGGFIWVANAEVAVLSEHDQSLCLLGNCLSHEARVVVEAVNVTFVASIEEDRASLGVPVGVVNKVPHLEALRLSIGSKVIYFGPKHEGLSGIFPFSVLIALLGRREPHSSWFEFELGAWLIIRTHLGTRSRAKDTEGA